MSLLKFRPSTCPCCSANVETQYNFNYTEKNINQNINLPIGITAQKMKILSTNSFIFYASQFRLVTCDFSHQRKQLRIRHLLKCRRFMPQFLANKIFSYKNQIPFIQNTERHNRSNHHEVFNPKQGKHKRKY